MDQPPSFWKNSSTPINLLALSVPVQHFNSFNQGLEPNRTVTGHFHSLPLLFGILSHITSKLHRPRMNSRTYSKHICLINLFNQLNCSVFFLLSASRLVWEALYKYRSLLLFWTSGYFPTLSLTRMALMAITVQYTCWMDQFSILLRYAALYYLWVQLSSRFQFHIIKLWLTVGNLNNDPGTKVPLLWAKKNIMCTDDHSTYTNSSTT